MYPEQQIVITQNNYSDYIDIPQFILDKHKQGIIPNAHFSDVIRLLLLCKYGGVWIDATCLLTSEIPNEIMSSELFYFKSRIWGEWPFVPSKALLNPLVGHLSVFEGYITGSSWFIVAKKNNYILEKTKQMLLEYWKNENSLVDYFTFHYIMSLIIINDRKAKEIYEKMINKNNVIPHLLQGRLPWDWDKDIYEEVKTFSFIHKLTYYMNLEQAKENPKSFYNKIIEFNSKTNDR